jgi:hypothetical protein
MARFLNPEWQDLRDAERAAFEDFQDAQKKLTTILADDRIPSDENQRQVDRSLRNWKAARGKIDDWITAWLEGQAQP